MQRLKRRSYGSAKRAIQNLGKPELFRHKSAIQFPESQSARQRGIRLIGGFARDGCYWQEKTGKQPVNTRGRNSKDNTRSSGHQNIANQETQHNPVARLPRSCIRNPLRECGYASLEPVKVKV